MSSNKLINLVPPPDERDQEYFGQHVYETGIGEFEKLLDRLPRLTFLRQLNASTLRDLYQRKKGDCTWCGGLVPPPRKHWCGKECLHQFRLRCDPGYQAMFVRRRDGRNCSNCGQTAYCEVDHTIAVALGGGLCGPKGLRLLCSRCHRIETNRLRATLSLRRRKDAR